MHAAYCACPFNNTWFISEEKNIPDSSEELLKVGWSIDGVWLGSLNNWGGCKRKNRGRARILFSGKLLLMWQSNPIEHRRWMEVRVFQDSVFHLHWGGTTSGVGSMQWQAFLSIKHPVLLFKIHNIFHKHKASFPNSMSSQTLTQHSIRHVKIQNVKAGGYWWCGDDSKFTVTKQTTWNSDHVAGFQWSR